MKKGLFGFNVRNIVEIAIFCALAIVLDTFVKIPLGASGGSINISMLPLFVVAIRHGWFKGFFAAGLVYGLITCLLDGYGFVCYPLDYLIGFGSIAIVGLISPFLINNFGKSVKHTIICYLLVILSVSMWATVRFFASSLSSVLVWKYTWSAAFLYNVSYIFISAVADIVLLSLSLYVIVKLNKIYPTDFVKSVRINANDE